nr:translation initiation factor IF-2-like [Aegilops tauschii subsp. strangulata]
MSRATPSHLVGASVPAAVVGPPAPLPRGIDPAARPPRPIDGRHRRRPLRRRRSPSPSSVPPRRTSPTPPRARCPVPYNYLVRPPFFSSALLLPHTGRAHGQEPTPHAPAPAHADAPQPCSPLLPCAITRIAAPGRGGFRPAPSDRTHRRASLASRRCWRRRQPLPAIARVAPPLTLPPSASPCHHHLQPRPPAPALPSRSAATPSAASPGRRRASCVPSAPRACAHSGYAR